MKKDTISNETPAAEIIVIPVFSMLTIQLIHKVIAKELRGSVPTEKATAATIKTLPCPLNGDVNKEYTCFQAVLKEEKPSKSLWA